ncbi:MAG: hypothetical protein QW726_00060 [Fervidicoccaceae archaeon]
MPRKAKATMTIRLFDKPGKKGGKPRIREEIKIEDINVDVLQKLVELIVVANVSQTAEINLGEEVAKLFKAATIQR